MQNRVRRNQNLWDKTWRNKEGDIVIWQRPNLLLLAWVVLSICCIFSSGTISSVFWYASVAVLGIWALLEIFLGANYFRRFLGVVIAAVIVAAFFKVGY